MNTKLMKIVIAIIFIFGFSLLANGFYMPAKAQLAQTLISHSWDSRAADSLPSKPWFWADFYAIATLEVAALDSKVYVMQDASGEALAFGPGHMPLSDKPGGLGHVVIAGHRDTHFALLEQIEINHEIVLTNYQDESIKYRVVDLSIIDVNEEEIQIEQNTDLLTLITCYPFNTLIPNGPLRLLVTAESIGTNDN